MILTLPLPPNRANQNRGQAHWEWVRKKRYMEGTKRRVGACTLAVGQLRGASLPLGPTQVSATFYLHQRMDDDNLTARLKWPLDVLVKAGILVDDKRPHCEVVPPVQFIDRRYPRVEISLLPCSGA